MNLKSTDGLRKYAKERQSGGVCRNHFWIFDTSIQQERCAYCGKRKTKRKAGK